MGSATKSPRDIATEFRDPNFAATLSLMPGLGQIYVGQRRKGTLFLAVGLINLFILTVLLFQQSMLFSLHECANVYHFKANQSLSDCLSMLRIGSPQANILLSCIFGFITLAMRDARTTATQVELGGLYPTSAIGLEEAASASHVLHVGLIIAAFILAFFFVAVPPPSKQFTVIEMVDTELTTTKKRQETKLNSSHNTQVHGLKSHETPAQASQQSATSSNSKTKVVSKAERKVALEKPETKPTMAPPAMAHPAAAPVRQAVPQPVLPMPTQSMAKPVPLPLRRSSARATAPNPTDTPAAKSPNPPPAPQPQLNLAQLPKAALGPAPRRFEPNILAAPIPVGSSAARSNAHQDFGSSAPQASAVNVQPASGSPSNTPSPIGEYQKTGRGKSQGTPAPTRANFSGGPANAQQLAFGPAVLGNGTGREAKKGASPMDGTKGPAEPETREIDWGPYMNDLQRRIKTHWFPARNLESVTVVVVFKVSKNGELSNLRLQRSSGYAEADKRALVAVEDAAPFRSLPAGSDPIVDIQFTFDYNVFKGGGRSY